MANILVIDDDIYICKLLERFLKRHGYGADFTITAKKALELINENSYDLVFCDYRLPDATGKEVLEKIKAVAPHIPVIIITAYSDVKVAVEIIKSGAVDYITKPILPEELLLLIDKVLAAGKAPSKSNGQSDDALQKTKAKEVKQALASNSQRKYIVGKGKESRELQKQIELVAPTNYSVILYGESGTGKESIAYGIHQLSARAGKPFVAVDCGALTRELAGSELFGHEKGAFTGALQSKVGQFELADGGTIFLDEIANLSYDIQVSLLRVVQERKIRRVGSQKETEIDVRIIVASNEKLSKATAQGRFREDLYHRFNEFSINLPSLRERSADIMLFAEFFLNNVNQELGKDIQGFSPEVVKIFKEYSWPGNLRELNNVIKRAALLTDKEIMYPEALPQEIVFQSKFNLADKEVIRPAATAAGQPVNLKLAALEAEYEMILDVLKKVNYNKSKAAKYLGIDRKTLYNKMKAHNLLDG